MRFAALVSSLIPTPCLFCGAGASAGGVCIPCRADLPGWRVQRCPVCAIATPQGEVCGQCLRSPPAFARTVVAASYAFPLDAAVARLKYGRDLGLAAGLADLLREAVHGETLPALMIPMPLSAARMRERGFNQAAELARPVAARLGACMLPDAARRTRDAAPQASLPLAAREKNVRGAFECDRHLDAMEVAIVDDVMTTGASLDELARTLRSAGAARVVCWVLARTERAG
jgi:ComF family protein